MQWSHDRRHPEEISAERVYLGLLRRTHMTSSAMTIGPDIMDRLPIPDLLPILTCRAVPKSTFGSTLTQALACPKSRLQRPWRMRRASSTRAGMGWQETSDAVVEQQDCESELCCSRGRPARSARYAQAGA